MNEWDEKIHRDSLARDLCPMGFEDQEAFTIGARWQREALLSDEAVERVADILEALDGDDYLTVARAALTVAIGGDDE